MPQQMGVKGPDGKIYQFPSDATDEEILRFFQQVGGNTPAPVQPTANKVPGSGLGTMQQAMQMATQAVTGIPAAQQADAMQAIVGMGKSALGTIEGGGKLLRKYVPGMDALPSVELPVSTTPVNTPQRVGKLAGDVAQFFVPGTALGKLKTAATTGVGLLDALIGAGIEGASAGAIGAAQSGDLKQGAKVGALTAGTGLATSAMLAAAKPLAEKIENALVKPTKADLEDGFKTSNVFKYDVGGSLKSSYDKVQAKLGNLSKQLRSALKDAPAGAEIDLADELKQAMASLEGKASTTFGKNAAMERAANQLLDEIPYVTSTGKVDVATANEVKQAVGSMGAWLHDPTGRTYGADNAALETLANRFYGRLKTAIETASGQASRVQQINREIGDLLPINRAIIRRIPVEQRQQVLNLGDLLSFSTKTWWLSALNRLMKSGQAASGLNAVGEAAPTLAPATGRIVGGLGGEIR